MSSVRKAIFQFRVDGTVSHVVPFDLESAGLCFQRNCVVFKVRFYRFAYCYDLKGRHDFVCEIFPERLVVELFQNGVCLLRRFADNFCRVWQRAEFGDFIDRKRCFLRMVVWNKRIEGVVVGVEPVADFA